MPKYVALHFSHGVITRTRAGLKLDVSAFVMSH